jgi:hypothetical protein
MFICLNMVNHCHRLSTTISYKSSIFGHFHSEFSAHRHQKHHKMLKEIINIVWCTQTEQFTRSTLIQIGCEVCVWLLHKLESQFIPYRDHATFLSMKHKTGNAKKENREDQNKLVGGQIIKEVTPVVIFH